MKNTFEIDRKYLKNYLGKPVWYQCNSDVNDFGWAFIHPETVGTISLPYCKLILPDPHHKDFYSWSDIRIYNHPYFHGICYHCDHYKKPGCKLKKPDCGWSNRYQQFQAAPFWENNNYTVKTFVRQINLSGYKIKEEETCKSPQAELPGLRKP